MIFKGDEREFLEIELSDFVDSEGWLGAGVYIEVPGFSANYGICVLLDEMERFYAELVKVAQQTSKTAKLYTMEEGLHMKCELQRNGRIECTGRAQDVGTGNALDFRISIENQALFNVLAQFERFFKKCSIVR